MLHFINPSLRGASIITALASISKPVAPQPDYSLPNLILMAVYVAATLVLVGVTIWQARAILAASARQSKDAIEAVHKQIEASEVQSLTAIAAVHDQIEASKIQSQTAIEAVHKQIEASERQALEAIHNQYKPVIVPTMGAINFFEGLAEVAIENAGLGIALSIWGTVASKSRGKYYSSSQALFLTPNKSIEATFVGVEGVPEGYHYVQYPYNMFYPHNMFETTGGDVSKSYFIFPEDNGGVPCDIRLMLTYKDVFDNKYLAVFDKSKEFGWKQVTLRKVEKTMEELTENWVLQKLGIAELFNKPRR